MTPKTSPPAPGLPPPGPSLMDRGQPPGPPSPAMDCPRVPAGSRFPHGPLRLRQSPPPPSPFQCWALHGRAAADGAWQEDGFNIGLGPGFRRLSAGWLAATPRACGTACRLRMGSPWRRVAGTHADVGRVCAGRVFGVSGHRGTARAWPASGSVVMIRILPMNMSVAARWRTRCAGRPMRRGCEAVCVRA